MNAYQAMYKKSVSNTDELSAIEVCILKTGVFGTASEEDNAIRAAAEYAALLEKVERLEDHARKLIGLALSFNEDDPWIFERYGGDEIVSSASAALDRKTARA